MIWGKVWQERIATMPIDFDPQIKPVSEPEFRERDYEVMNVAFSTHNELGCLCDEKVYQNEMLHCCLENGFATVQKKVPLIVSHKEFSKTFYIDMLVNHGVVYELKAVKTISSAHRSQSLNYLMLTGLNFGKIINFGSLFAVAPVPMLGLYAASKIAVDALTEAVVLEGSMWGVLLSVPTLFALPQ